MFLLGFQGKCERVSELRSSLLRTVASIAENRPGINENEISPTKNKYVVQLAEGSSRVVENGQSQLQRHPLQTCNSS